MFRLKDGSKIETVPNAAELLGVTLDIRDDDSALVFYGTHRVITDFSLFFLPSNVCKLHVLHWSEHPHLLGSDCITVAIHEHPSSKQLTLLHFELWPI
jgi:hypothetical protein